MLNSIRVGILTCSTSRKALREDRTGIAVRDLMEKNPNFVGKKKSHAHWGKHKTRFIVVSHKIVPDKIPAITTVLKKWCDQKGLDLVLTTGGTGCTQTDVTPEATRKVIEREVPGPAEMIRFFSLFRNRGEDKVPISLLSRGVCGIRRKTLLLNLPGSPRGARESLSSVLPLLPHIVELMRRD
ncbi:MAG: MogA/MoaB family molybdenum cofactor biosynthesis protein [Elusimicrobia bacterium]|nr:MogA/MoaB family molybdenum cofactor biosynthesis protein [Elusimicrobiota bacterium]